MVGSCEAQMGEMGFWENVILIGVLLTHSMLKIC